MVIDEAQNVFLISRSESALTSYNNTMKNRLSEIVSNFFDRPTSTYHTLPRTLSSSKCTTFDKRVKIFCQTRIVVAFYGSHHGYRKSKVKMYTDKHCTIQYANLQENSIEFVDLHVNLVNL